MMKFQFWLPTRDKLTKIQKRAIESRRAILLTGVPGTGKTVISIYRLIDCKSGILFTYGKLLRKTIEEKFKSLESKARSDEERSQYLNKKIVNIHRWHYDLTKDESTGMLEKNLSDEQLEETIKMIQAEGILYDEILVDEGQDLSPNAYKLFSKISDYVSVSADEAQMVNNLERASTEADILNVLPKLQKITLDTIFRNSYEIYDFARQFVPNNARANDPNLIERLQEDNSGADEPYVYLVANYDMLIQEIQAIFDDNATDNIGVFLEKIADIDEHAKKFDNVSVYHSKCDVPKELNNKIITTYKSAKGVEFDVVIMSEFHNASEKNMNEYFVGATRAKTQVHIICIQELPEVLKNFRPETYTLIDNRNKEE